MKLTLYGWFQKWVYLQSIISISPSTIRAPLTLLGHSIFNPNRPPPPPPFLLLEVFIFLYFTPSQKKTFDRWRRSKCRHTRSLQNLSKDQRYRQSYSHRNGPPRQKSRSFNWGVGGGVRIKMEWSILHNAADGLVWFDKFFQCMNLPCQSIPHLFGFNHCSHRCSHHCCCRILNFIEYSRLNWHVVLSNLQNCQVAHRFSYCNKLKMNTAIKATVSCIKKHTLWFDTYLVGKKSIILRWAGAGTFFPTPFPSGLREKLFANVCKKQASTVSRPILNHRHPSFCLEKLRFSKMIIWNLHWRKVFQSISQFLLRSRTNIATKK